MPLIVPPSASGRYIVRSQDSGQLAEFLKSVSVDPAVELLDTIGPADRPHTAVVAMSHEKAVSLQQRFSSTSDQLIIEPDRPLSLFGEEQND